MYYWLVLCLTHFSASPQQWLQYGGPGRTFAVTTSEAPGEARVAWRQPLGGGTSALISDGSLLYTQSIRLKAGSKTEGEEIVAARELATGKVIWEQNYAVSRLKGQESFSGDAIRPQATPALHLGVLCTLSYSGLLCGWDAHTGKQLWQHDLVKELEAKPVQFGFSASPLIYQDSLIVHVGGKQAALVRFDAITGKVMWKSEPGEPSYASPTLAMMDGEQHLVQVTRDAVLGIDPATGKTLWKYAMPEAGLTNVPTPLPLERNQLLVSGQGIKGTRLLRLEKTKGDWQITEAWHNSKVTFFYCNWQIVGNAVYGNANKILVGLSLADGKELWRERGYPEANLVQLGSHHYILDGDGKLTCCKLSPAGVEKIASQAVLSTRCWTPPTPVGNLLLLRDQAELIAVQWTGVSK